MTGPEHVRTNHDSEITAHHSALGALEHDPFIDGLPSISSTSSAEVPHLDDLAKKAISAEVNTNPAKAEVIVIHGLHAVAANNRGNHSHAA
jgi:uridine kinase